MDEKNDFIYIEHANKFYVNNHLTSTFVFRLKFTIPLITDRLHQIFDTTLYYTSNVFMIIT